MLSVSRLHSIFTHNNTMTPFVGLILVKCLLAIDTSLAFVVILITDCLWKPSQILTRTNIVYQCHRTTNILSILLLYSIFTENDKILIIQNKTNLPLC